MIAWMDGKRQSRQSPRQWPAATIPRTQGVSCKGLDFELNYHYLLPLDEMKKGCSNVIYSHL